MNRTNRKRPRARVLWLTPDKPANISVGRERIATHLGDRGFEVVLRGTTIGTVLAALRKGKFDAVIGTTRAGAVAGAVVATAKRCPLVVDHVDPIRQFAESVSSPLATAVRWLENAAFARAAHVLYVYPEERARVERFAAHSSKTELGVEFDRFEEPSPEALRAATARLDAFDIQEKVAIYLGGLEPIYHIEALLASVEHLEDWSLLVIGDGSRSGIVERAAKRNEKVIYLGSVAHEAIPGYLHVADVGVSLVDDPHTLKVLEYGAAGLSVVQLTGRAEARFGDRVEYCTADPADVARAIEAAYDADSGRAQRTPEPDREGTAVENRTPLGTFASGFDWEAIAVEYARVLTRAIDSAG